MPTTQHIIDRINYYVDATIITPGHQINEIISACDQAHEARPGCITWVPQGKDGAECVTYWPEEGRIAMDFGADSVWGDMEMIDDMPCMRTDSDPNLIYNIYGEEVDAG